MAEKFRYDLEFDEDTHWRLVRIGALKKMHQEDFLEELITSVMDALAMDKEKEESTQTDHIPGTTKMVPPPVATDEELLKLWNSTNTFKQSLRAIYNLGIEHGQACSREVAEPAPVAGGLAAQAVLDAVVSHPSFATRKRIAAALCSVADLPKELEIPFNVITDWEAIPGSCTRLHAAAMWGYNQALAAQRAIATELETKS